MNKNALTAIAMLAVGVAFVLAVDLPQGVDGATRNAIKTYTDSAVSGVTVNLTGLNSGGGTGILTNFADIHATTLHGDGSKLTGISAAGGNVFTASNNTFTVGATNIFNGRTVLGGLRAAVANPWAFSGYTGPANAGYPNVVFGNTQASAAESCIAAFVVTNAIGDGMEYIWIGDNSATANGIKVGTYRTEGAFIGYNTNFKIYDQSRSYQLVCDATTGIALGNGGFLGVGISTVGLTTINGAAGFKLGANGTTTKQVPSATASLGFPTALTVGQYEDKTISVTGATNFNAVALGLPTDVPTDSVFTGFVSAPGVVTVRRSAITTCAAYTNTFRATVIIY